MPAPKKIFKKLEGGGRGMLSTGGAARKAVVKVKPKPNTKAEPKSNVRVVSGKKNTAPKTGLENRGARPTRREQTKRAQELRFDKAERDYEASIDIRASGLRSSKEGLVRPKGPGKANKRKNEIIKKEAEKRVIKITGK